jgi:hypothetical protein
MIPWTGDIRAETDGASRSPLQPAPDVAARYGISALSGLLAGARASIGEDEISVAVLGRVKAGKSSFLNHSSGSASFQWESCGLRLRSPKSAMGPAKRREFIYQDGRDPQVPLNQIGGYVSEKENPENTKRVDMISGRQRRPAPLAA